MADRQDLTEKVRVAAPKRSSAAPIRPGAEAPAKPGEPPRQTPPNDRVPRPAAPDRGERDSPPPQRRFPWAATLIALVVVALVIAGVAYWWTTAGEVSTDDAFTDGDAVVIAPHVSGYVVKLAVNDNEFVHRGQLLVKIDPRDFVAARDQTKAQLDLAEAQLRNAKIAHEIAKTTYPARLQSAKAQLDAAKATQAKAQADYNRYKRINPAAVTREQLDTVKAALAQANAQVAQAEAAVTEASVVPQNIAQTAQQVSQWEAQVEAAQAQLAQAELNLSYTDLVAPRDGWVTKRNVAQGNYVQAATQIMALVSPEVWITANFKETQLTRMRAGDKASINVDAYPFLNLKGHVDSIQKGSGAKFSAFPTENATGNFVKVVQRLPVKIVIDSGLDPKLPLPLGLSVEPTVTVSVK